MADYSTRDWYYDEFQQVGIDFGSADEVARYDEEIGRGINQRDNCNEIVDALGLRETDRVLEIGTATGRLAIDLAAKCAQVYAVDISQAMLDFASLRAQRMGRYNVEFARAGFLTYCPAVALDAVVTKFALHHLPDHWKFVAAKKMHDMLKPGGRLFLKDAVISVEINDFFDSVDLWVSNTREASGEKPASAVVACIKDEYPTYAWIMEKMLKLVGFRIDAATHAYGLHSTFICTKQSSLVG